MFLKNKIEGDGNVVINSINGTGNGDSNVVIINGVRYTPKPKVKMAINPAVLNLTMAGRKNNAGNRI